MDIWQWVEQKQGELEDAGHDRLADIVEMIPSYTVDGEHHKVDALVPEGIAYARKLDEKWVELFLRHWHLQSLVLHRMQVKDVLDKAVSLLDFAHQESTRECPQSICAVQDLANCYGNIDGPGYVSERLDVARESLDKIDPRWPCYTCIAAEYASALYNGDRYEEALQFLDDCDSALMAHGEERDTSYLLQIRIDTLIELERYDEAARCASRLDNPYGGETFAIDARITHASVNFHLGNLTEASNLLPDFEEVRHLQSNYEDWCDVAYQLAINNSLKNDYALGNIFQDCVHTLIAQGVIRTSVTLAQQAAELALFRNQPHIALAQQKTITDLIPQLVKPLGADKMLDQLSRKISVALEKQVQALTETLPDNVETLLEQLSDDSETALSQLNVARSRWPDNPALLIEKARQLGLLHRADEKLDLLNTFLQDYPDSAKVLLEYGFTLLDEKGSQAFRQFAEQISANELSQDSRLNLAWIRAHDYKRANEFDEAKQQLRDILELTPNAYNTCLMLAELERDTENHAGALRLVERLLELDAEDADLHWDRIVLATLLKDWQRVRDSAKILEIELSDETGPISEEWGRCRIQFSENNESRIYSANRTGPVTAEIITVAHRDDTQRYGDTLVFDPSPLNRLDQEDEEGYPMDSEGNYTYLYRPIKTITQGSYSTYTLDGVHPGEEQLDQLAIELQKHQALISERSTEEYTLTVPADSQELLAIYAYILIPQESSLRALADTLAEVTRSYTHPLIWPDILAELGDNEMLTEQNNVAEKYGITD